jgi:putative NADPH-quinone reductase
MKIMVIIDHPWPESFNHAIARRAADVLERAGHQVDVVDLHQEDFDPVLRREELAGYARGETKDPRVPEYQRRIAASDHLVFVFPVWWETMPAMLKGFIDKVFLPGWAFAEADAAPLLGHIGGATVITTMGAPEAIHTSVEAAFCKGVLEFCGIAETTWLNIVDVGNVTQQERTAWLDGVAGHLEHLR